MQTPSELSTSYYSISIMVMNLSIALNPPSTFNFSLTVGQRRRRKMHKEAQGNGKAARLQVGEMQCDDALLRSMAVNLIVRSDWSTLLQ